MDEKRLHILRAAFEAGNRYGFKRASMADIAKEAGISRPTLYLYFSNKEEIVKSSLALSIDQAFAAADFAVKSTNGEFVDKLIAYMGAYIGHFHKLLLSTPHAEELSEVSQVLDSEQTRKIKSKQIEKVNAIAGLPSDDEFGILLVQASEGVKHGAENEEQLSQRLERLIRALASQIPKNR